MIPASGHYEAAVPYQGAAQVHSGHRQSRQGSQQTSTSNSFHFSAFAFFKNKGDVINVRTVHLKMHRK
jgi:hypothetical protein